LKEVIELLPDYLPLRNKLTDSPAIVNLPMDIDDFKSKKFYVNSIFHEIHPSGEVALAQEIRELLQNLLWSESFH